MRANEHTLEFLLSFDGRLHWYAEGYFTKFEIKRIEPSPERPHGLRYSLTLHDPAGRRLVGFDNAHGISMADLVTKNARPSRTIGTGRKTTLPGRTAFGTPRL